MRSTKFNHLLTANTAPPEHKHTPHLLFHVSANQLAQKSPAFLAPYCKMSFPAISALFLLYIHIGKSLWFTRIPCNKASACRVSIIKQQQQQQQQSISKFEDECSDAEVLTKAIRYACTTSLAMGPVRILHSSHDSGWQSSHSVDLAGWQAKMASIESLDTMT